MKVSHSELSRLALATCLGLVCGGAPALADGQALEVDLKNLSLEALMDLEVTSAAKKPQKLSEVAAAVFVITAEDIRRSGATTIADLLRMAPGMEVAKFNNFGWRVAARGSFNGVYVNKLQVFIDGRSVYSPQFAGVYWDKVDVLLEDVERIEVIRGPGGAVWGANAVNGVVNIISKKTTATQGHLVVAGTGDEERNFVRLRHGGMLDDGLTGFRVYAKSSQQDSGAGGFSGDAKHYRQAGFRLDGMGENAQWLLQGDSYYGENEDLNWASLQAGLSQSHGSNVLGRREYALAHGARLSVQGYFDYTRHDTPTFEVSNRVVDAEAQYRRRFGDKHEVVLGLGYRWLYSDVAETSLVRSSEPVHKTQVLSAYVQDEVSLGQHFNLILGTKLERNDYTGLEIQPNLRAWWRLDEQRVLWGAVSRAVRTPSQFADHVEGEFVINDPLRNPYPLPLVFVFRGNPDLKPESVLAYELGLRDRVGERFSWDLAGFYQRYRDLTVRLEQATPDFANGRILLEGDYYNSMRADTYGLEAALNWLQGHWRAQLAYSWLRMRVDDPLQTSYDQLDGENPRHQVSLRAGLQLNPAWSVDAWLRYVSALESSVIGAVPAYTELDLRLAWQVTPALEVSLVGQNLLDSAHREFGTGAFNPLVTEVQRGVYAQLRWEM